MMVKRFLDAIRTGAALAGLALGCSGEQPAATPQDGAVAADVGSQAVSALPPLPSDLELMCTGTIYPPSGTPGYHGQCCERVVCREPVNGECPTGNDGRSYGSGSCLCGAAKPRGPFAVAADDPKYAQQRQAGPCCYVTPSISCDGRPLNVEHEVRVAAVIERSDWG